MKGMEVESEKNKTCTFSGMSGAPGARGASGRMMMECMPKDLAATACQSCPAGPPGPKGPRISVMQKEAKHLIIFRARQAMLERWVEMVKQEVQADQVIEKEQITK